MQTAQILFQQIAAMALLILLGVFCERKKIFTREGAQQCCNFMMVVVLPVNTIRAFQQERTDGDLFGFWMIFLFAVLFHVISCLVATVAIPRRPDDRFGVERIGTVLTNSGFVGFPLITAAVGEAGIIYGAAYSGPFLVTAWTWSLAQLVRRDKLSVKRILVNPGVIALVVALTFYLCNIRLHPILYTAIDYTYDLNMALSSVVLGVFLSRISLRETFSDKNIYRVVLLRNFILPLILLFVFWATDISNLFPDARTASLVLLICACTPSAVATMMTPAKFGGDSEHGAKIVAVSSLFSILSAPLIIYLAQRVL